VPRLTSQKRNLEFSTIMDPLSIQRRSEVMGKIRCKKTLAELRVARILRLSRYKYSANDKRLPGSPDFVLYRRKSAIFVHGCFWHRHNCAKGQSIPSSRRAFWNKKFINNKKRDARVTRALRSMGWHVMIIWECQLKHPENVSVRIQRFLRKNRSHLSRN
jgi:DNA mismatch endonuclease, patch repair protein